jgi:toxin ParE1/3/4
MKIVWSRRAIRNLEALRDYIEQSSEQNAAAVAKRILHAVDLLENHPAIGRPGRVMGTRELVIPDTPYIVVYRVKRDRLELIAVLHGHQRWPRRF